MAVNLATKYEKKIAEKFTISSVVEGYTSGEYNWDGVKGIVVYTPVTQPLNDYKRTGTNRYGEPQEMQDTTQEMKLRKDRAFSITIDKGNNTEQMMIKEGGRMLSLEIDEQVTPEMDQYALGEFANNAGMVAALSAAPTKTTIAQTVADALTALSNAMVPNNNRVIWIGWTMFGLLRMSPEYIENDGLGKQVLTRGTIGTFMGAEVRPIPDKYLTRGGKKVYFLVAHKRSILQPKKIRDYFVKTNPPGINGALLEGRFVYDAFVLGSKADGVYAAVEKGSQLTTPTASYASKAWSVTATGADGFKYTLDGTDPRYSQSAKEAAGASGTISAAGMEGQTVTVKIASFAAGAFTSAVYEDTQEIS